MDEIINKKRNVRDHVKMGFFDSTDLEKLLDTLDFNAEFKNNKAAQITCMLGPIFDQLSN